MLTARRFPENPILHPGLHPSLGNNLNGPSLLRVPDWLPNPLGRYYLYFAHHQGLFIRLAYADDLHGPWQIYVPGTLRLEQTCCQHHLASPDVHVDDERREIVMYFHGCVEAGQRSFRALSRDGLHFVASREVLGPFYFRVFRHGGWHYAIAKSVDAPGGGVLLRSPDGQTPFEPGPELLPRMRHVAVQYRPDAVRLFFSRGEDCPERLLTADMSLAGDWLSWTPGEIHELLAPEEDYEGGKLPLEQSSFGAVFEPARQLRDPAIHEEDGRTYLLYACGGESGICLAELVQC